MKDRFEHEEEVVARLVAALPPPPAAWVEAAAVLPRTRHDADRIVALAEADQQFRAAVAENLQAALREIGYEPTTPLLAAVRERLHHP
jgi:uncharacterized membrane protein